MGNRKGENNSFYGKHHTEETKAKIQEKTMGRIPWNKGKHLSEEHKEKDRKSHLDKKASDATKQKMSNSHKGANNHFYGKHHTKEAIEKIRKKQKPTFTEECIEEKRKQWMGENNPNYGGLTEETKQKLRVSLKRAYNTPEGKRKQCERRAKQIFPNHHTRPERIFEEICKKHNLPFHYVGDGQLWIGKTKKLNPDFCELNGKKIIIEIMGDYWHSPLLNRKLREDANLNYRKRHYKKYGWQSYFIWGSDLMRPDAEQFVISQLEGVIR